MAEITTIHPEKAADALGIGLPDLLAMLRRDASDKFTLASRVLSPLGLVNGYPDNALELAMHLMEAARATEEALNADEDN